MQNTPHLPAAAPACEGYLNAMSKLGVLVGDFYLLLGQAHEPAALPGGIRPGRMRECYRNAGVLAADLPDLVYCEGFALQEGLFPMHHAWCVDRQGRVVDPTWPFSPSNEYHGVALSNSFVREVQSKTGVWGVLGERLPDDVIQSHPDGYLHAQWLPAKSRRDEWWAKVEPHRALHPRPR